VAVALVVAAVAAVTGGCGVGAREAAADRPTPEASVVRTLTPDPAADTVPAAPRDRAVLTLTGRISSTNADDRLRLDQAGLDRLGLLEVGVYDPWVKQRLDLQGVWLADLVKLAGPDAAASSLHLRALDDYQVDLRLDDVRAGGIFLATRKGDGGEIPVEEGGPTRVVFADSVTAGFSPDLWIWSIDTIDVR
jgi:hypothetical protein